MADPQPEDIREAADRANVFIGETVQNAQQRADRLRSVITWSEIVSKVGQYAGGAGALVFGLNENGRNAAYAGAVAGLATLYEQLVKPNEKSEHRATCLELANMRIELEKITGGWRLQANDPPFRATFVNERAQFYDRVDNRYGRCNK